VFAAGVGAAYSLVAADELISKLAVDNTWESREDTVKLPARKCRTLRDVGLEREGTSGPTLRCVRFEL